MFNALFVIVLLLHIKQLYSIKNSPKQLEEILNFELEFNVKYLSGPPVKLRVINPFFVFLRWKNATISDQRYMHR